jgi:hypothetical protein
MLRQHLNKNIILDKISVNFYVCKYFSHVVPCALLSKKLAIKLRVPRACAFGIRPVIFSIIKNTKNANIE